MRRCLRVLLYLLDEVRDDLGVGFGNELVALRDQLALQIKIVFNDAVVHDDDAPCAVAMGMRVLFRGPAMRGPARVPDAERALRGLLAQDFFKIWSLPGARHTDRVARLGCRLAMPAES